MSLSSSNPMDHFPYQPRPNQEQAVTHAAGVFRGRKIGMLSAGCGVGKTIAALAGWFAARDNDSSAQLLILTRTHSQSEVFESELEQLRKKYQEDAGQSPVTSTSMVSRSHMCPFRHQLDTDFKQGFLKSCAEAIKTGRCSYYWSFYKSGKGEAPRIRAESVDLVDELVKKAVISRTLIEEQAQVSGSCPYEIMRWCAKSSKVLIGSYGYLFNHRARRALLSTLSLDLNQIDLLIDEAHNLPSFVLSSEGSLLTGKDIEALLEQLPHIENELGVSWVGESIEFLFESLMTHLDQLSGNEEELPAYDVFPRFVVPEQLEALVTGGQFESLSTKLEGKVDQLLDFLFNAFRAIDSNSWHITLELLNPNWEVSRSNAALAIRPLNSAGLTAPVLVNARSALLMSGTMRPSEHYARLLGITSPDVAEIDSPFPRDSRIILVDKQLTTKYTERNECLWRNIAAKIEATLESVPADKSALVAFPSYRIMNQVLSYDINNRYRGKIKEKRGVRIEAVLDALLDRPHTIFSVYAGRLTEGVDLVDEGSSLLNLIIAVGVPFSPPTSYNLALQEFYNQRFGHGHGYYYSSVLPAIRRVTQLIGRLRRSLRDRGICVLLDNRFVKYSRVLGDDVIADMWPYIGLSELREAIEWFIEGGRNRNE